MEKQNLDLLKEILKDMKKEELEKVLNIEKDEGNMNAICQVVYNLITVPSPSTVKEKKKKEKAKLKNPYSVSKRSRNSDKNLLLYLKKLIKTHDLNLNYKFSYENYNPVVKKYQSTLDFLTWEPTSDKTIHTHCLIYAAAHGNFNILYYLLSIVGLILYLRSVLILLEWRWIESAG